MDSWTQGYEALRQARVDFFLLASSPIPLTFLRPYIPLLHIIGRCWLLCCVWGVVLCYAEGMPYLPLDQI